VDGHGAKKLPSVSRHEVSGDDTGTIGSMSDGCSAILGCQPLPCKVQELVG
jgi:hypothetical protein